MFLAMQATHSSDLPDWITVDAIRQSNLLIPLAVMRMQSKISRHGYLLILRAHEKIFEHIVLKSGRNFDVDSRREMIAQIP
jgi:hypothetical protein